jgi:hypothetical protein
VLEDLGRARQLFPTHQIMTVNGACSVIEDADHCLAGHTTKAEHFAAARRAAFPDALPWRLHAAWSYHKARRTAPPSTEYPSVTDWHRDITSEGTSAAKAARIGLALGFERIVLCGCPLDGSGYAVGEAKVPVEPGMQRVGCAALQDRRTIRRYREEMTRLAQGLFSKGRVTSMSGFTKQVLGAP